MTPKEFNIIEYADEYRPELYYISQKVNFLISAMFVFYILRKTMA